MKILFAAFVVLTLGTAARAQGPGTGFPMYGSFDGAAFDTTNRQNLNTNFSIPSVRSKGRGMNFTLSLSYNSMLWNISSGAWVSVTDSSGNPTWGLMKLYPTGMVTSTTSYAGQCKMTGDGTVSYNSYTNYVYYDQAGTGHPFPISWTYN